MGQSSNLNGHKHAPLIDGSLGASMAGGEEEDEEGRQRQQEEKTVYERAEQQNKESTVFGRREGLGEKAAPGAL